MAAVRQYITLGPPLHNDITGDSAYVVIPATMTFQVKGQKVAQTGALFTVALRKTAGGGASRRGHGPREPARNGKRNQTRGT